MKKVLAVSLQAAVLLLAPLSVSADTIALSLTGTTSVDLWGAGTLAGAANPGYGSFPGSGTWPGPIQSPVGGDGYLRKVDNGPGGGPYPAGDGIYFGGFGTDPNADGGTLAVGDASAVAGLKTVAFQLQIGQAFGYDLLNNDLSLIKLNYTTTTGGSGSLSADYGLLLNQFYNGAVSMPTGPGGTFQPEDIYVNLWGLQWDLSNLSNIASFEIEFTGVQHASLGQLQLNQSSDAYGESAFPQDPVYTSEGANANWTTGEGWDTGSAPASGKNVVLTGGSEIVVDSARTVAALTINAADGFEIKSQGGEVLTATSGITGAAETASDYTISAPLLMGDYNLIDLNANSNLTISGPITGAGFYKQGDGLLSLTGNNVYDSGNSDLATNGLMFRGGTNSISGTNTLSGTNEINFKIRQDTTVVLHGGDDRLDSKFVLKLLAASSKLVLGDEAGRSNLTVAGVGETEFETAVVGSKIVGGNAEVSTLTINNTSGATFNGDLGGAGANENNIALTKKGAGVQTLAGNNTYSGDTRVEGGLLQIGSATALSANSNVKLDGGVLGFNGGNYSGTLGTGAGQIQFVGDGGFAASGAVRSVTLNGGAGLTWGEGGFVGDESKLILSHASSNNTVDVTNAIDLGSKTRTVQVNNGSGSVDGRFSGVLSGTGGLNKTGTGTVEFTAANTYTGGTNIAEGAVVLSGANGSLQGDVKVGYGTSLQLLNTAAANNTNRIADDATVTMNGGVLNFTNPTAGATPAYSETIGEVALNQGANVIGTARVATGNTGALTIGTLSRQNGATVNFTGGSTMGLDTRNQVLITNVPTLTNGLIGAWATVGNDFAVYGSNGVAAAYYGVGANLDAAETTWNAATNIKMQGGAAGRTTTLTANRQVNSLNLQGASGGTVGNVVNLNGRTLQVTSGGILTSGGADTRQNQINNGALTAGTGGDAELVVTANGSTSIGATIVDNSTGHVSLTKAGANTLTLTANNTYSGGTVVNQGTLIVNGTQSGGGNLAVRKGATMNVNGSILVSGAVDVNGTLGGSGTITYSSLSGAGTVGMAVTVGSVAGQLSTLSPGNSPGVMNFVANQTWASGGIYEWELKDTTLSAGVGFDTINLTGSLTIASTALNPFTIDIISLTSADLAGLVSNFDSNASYSWTVLTASGGISGFDASLFTLETGNFAHSLAGIFSLNQDGNNLVLNYGAVPEPSVNALLLMSGVFVALIVRRHRQVA